MAEPKTANKPKMPSPADLLNLESLLSEEERMVRDTVGRFVRQRFNPLIEEHFEAGTFPRELIPEMGEMGLLGMHLEGYGCAGLSAVSYGLACQELEAGDSGLRSFVSVQGSLAMFPIWAFGSEEQKLRWLPWRWSGLKPPKAFGASWLKKVRLALAPPTSSINFR
jgi:glutaryl-CoA dehydrogenase